MKRGAWRIRGLVALGFIFSAGCAVLPSKSSSTSHLKAPVAERDMLADAARAVEAAPWPKPERVSLFARVNGGGKASVSRSDAIAAYVGDLQPAGARFARLEADARANLAAAERLNLAALQSAEAPRLAMNDVVLIEDAIRALRDHRDIYASAARELEKIGEPVDDERINMLRAEFRDAVKTLGDAADLLAERIKRDRSATFAGPDETTARRSLSDL